MQEEVKLDINPFIISNNMLVLAKRHPDILFGNHWHLPGGKVQVGERIIDALKRLSKAKTNLDIALMYENLEDNVIGIYDDPKRDKREHIIGVTFLCKVISKEMMKAGSNCIDVACYSRKCIMPPGIAPELGMCGLALAFDHEKIINDGFDFVELKENNE